MKNTIEDLTIADLKALRDYVVFCRGRSKSITYEYYVDAYFKIDKELHRRVEHIFGKP